MTDQNKPRVLVVGAAGSIGTALCRDLVQDHHVIALVGPGHPSAKYPSELGISWRSCEPFSQREVQEAVSRCDFAIYLAHTRMPTARLDQAACEDMDLLVADNFAQAASRVGIRQIIHLYGITREGDVSTSKSGEKSEIREVLGFYGTPVTTLKAGLIVAPGSSVLRLFGRLVQRFPVILLPRWANTQKQPIALPDVIRAVRFCLGNNETFGCFFDIGGVTLVSVREMLRTWSSALGKKRWILSPKHFHPRLFAAYLRLIDRKSHPGLIRLLIDNLRGDSLTKDNLVQRKIEKDAIPAEQILAPFFADSGGRLYPNPREKITRKREADLKVRSTVRSVQRVALPKDRNAKWVADTYFRWLPRYIPAMIRCEVDTSGSCTVFTSLPKFRLLELTFKPDHSTLSRRMYFITGGVLSRWHGDPKPRMEFRDMLGGKYTIIAIHDFTPRLSWGLYSTTQALFHIFVMQAFQRYLEKKSEALLEQE